MLSISVKAFSDDVQRVWAEVNSRREEVLEREEKVLAGRSSEWIHGFWRNAQKTLLRKSRCLPFVSFLINLLYGCLQKLVCLSMLLVLVTMIVYMFDDAPGFMEIIGKVAIIFLKIGLYIVALSVICWFCRKMYEGNIKGNIAVQQILTKRYNLISQYSDDVICYAVVMLAASELKLSIRGRTKRDLKNMTQNMKNGVFMLNTNDDIPRDDEYGEEDGSE